MRANKCISQKVQESAVQLKFHVTDTDTDTDSDMDFLADFRARILARKSACPALAARSARRQSPPTFVRRALFLTRMSVGDARVYMWKCTVHDKLSCTHLQNYTIGASLKSVSVSVSVPCNLCWMTLLRNLLCSQRSAVYFADRSAGVVIAAACEFLS